MGRQAKKLSLFNTLEILKKYTDEDHRLTQAEILDVKAKPLLSNP